MAENDNLEEKVNKLLSDPDSMSKVMSMMRQFTGGQDDSSSSAEASAESAPPSPPPPPQKDIFSSLTGGLGLNSSQISAILGALGNLNDPNDPNTRLISSLKPFMSETRSAHIDEAVRAMRLARAARTVLAGFTKRGKEAE